MYVYNIMCMYTGESQYSILLSMHALLQKDEPHNAKTIRTVLVHFEISIDVLDKDERSKEGDSTNHEEEDVAGEKSVTKELHRL